MIREGAQSGERNRWGLSVGHTVLQQFKGCQELFSLHNGSSWEATGVFSLRVTLFNKADKLCLGRRQAGQDQKEGYLREGKQAVFNFI